ncbi:MAG TPA: tRNA 2-selenouridine(34) synthase MnmH [Flavisolibacter sp.]|nr:tRNA 2-selenouridine(34) synthase MnmH [Flavisolibacter sp.]
MRRVQIDEFLSGSRNAVVLDVRSPGEYSHAHIPGAISLPLFTDEERKVVGTEYKQVSRQAAIKIGLDYFGPKMRGMVEEVEKLIDNRQQAISKDSDCALPIANCVFIYCWRGGMRSGAVAWLLNLYGFNVTVLSGGYKAFRNWVIQTYSVPYQLRVIGGYTGSGKTSLLQELKIKGEPVINLEELANHKGSAFGNIGMPPQPSQEMFENLLSLELKKVIGEFTMVSEAAKRDELIPHHSPLTLWIEDESQRIGQINIPAAFWQSMRSSPICFLDVPFEERLQNLVNEYGSLDKERMIAAIQRISKRLGPMETKTAVQFLQSGETKECFRILLHYYDKQYNKGLHNRENLDSLLTKISCEKVSVGNASLVSQAQLASIYAGTTS